MPPFGTFIILSLSFSLTLVVRFEFFLVTMGPSSSTLYVKVFLLS